MRFYSFSLGRRCCALAHRRLVLGSFVRRGSRLGHDVQQGLLSGHKAVHRLPGQIRQRAPHREMERIHHVCSMANRLHIYRHLLRGHVQKLLLSVDEGLGSFPSQFCQIGLLASLGGGVPICGIGRFLGHDVQEFLLAANEILHALACQLAQSLAFKRLAFLRRVDPQVRLLGRDRQKVLLHIDERVHAAAQQIGHCRHLRQTSGALLHGVHHQLVFPLRQVQQDSLRGDEVRHSLARHLRQGRRRRAAGARKPLPQGVEGIRVLPHHQIQQDPLSGEEALCSLAGPFR